jgi:hypothetical protein
VIDMATKSEKSIATLAAGAATLACSANALAQALPPSGPKTTGSPGPGTFAGGNVDYEDTGITGKVTFGTFGCNVFKENASTPDWQTANIYFERDVRGDKMKMPDGKEVPYWTFEDPLRKSGPREPLPAPLIRVQEDDLVHVRLKARKGAHTIHHHGIEPTTMNDGVGHVSMEITSSYVYQWQPRRCGTYFYHCHKNTVTHFEMGLYGLLIVDPKPDANGVVRAFDNGPAYDVEAMWVLDDMDPRWHQITDKDPDIGLCGEDAGLNVFEPKYFLLTGTPSVPGKPVDKQKIVAAPGKKILIRLLNASYSVLAVTFEGLQGEVISVDGHSLNKPWSRPVTVPAGSTFHITTAQRYDILIDTDAPANRGKKGTFRVGFEFQHWITRKRHNAGHRYHDGYLFTTITV